MYKEVPWAVLLRQTPICLVLFIWGGVWWGCLGRLGLSLGAPPIHIKPTQWAYGARKVFTWPPGWGARPSRTHGGIFKKVIFFHSPIILARRGTSFLLVGSVEPIRKLNAESRHRPVGGETHPRWVFLHPPTPGYM